MKIATAKKEGRKTGYVKEMILMKMLFYNLCNVQRTSITFNLVSLGREMSQNINFSCKGVKRLRFTADDVLALIREFVNMNPLDDAEKWKDIHSNILLTTGKSFLIRTLKDHLLLILQVWLKKDKSNQVRYSERDHLLQEISDMCKAKVVPLMKTKTVTKEEHISNLGKMLRDECSERLKENMPMEVM
nr:unnamed protein product [Callosobruchus analis]